jgi:hypothetical protein
MYAPRVLREEQHRNRLRTNLMVGACVWWKQYR